MAVPRHALRVIEDLNKQARTCYVPALHQHEQAGYTARLHGSLQALQVLTDNARAHLERLQGEKAALAILEITHGVRQRNEARHASPAVLLSYQTDSLSQLMVTLRNMMAEVALFKQHMRTARADIQEAEAKTKGAQITLSHQWLKTAQMEKDCGHERFTVDLLALGSTEGQDVNEMVAKYLKRNSDHERASALSKKSEDMTHALSDFLREHTAEILAVGMLGDPDIGGYMHPFRHILPSVEDLAQQASQKETASPSPTNEEKRQIATHELSVLVRDLLGPALEFSVIPSSADTENVVEPGIVDEDPASEDGEEPQAATGTEPDEDLRHPANKMQINFTIGATTCPSHQKSRSPQEAKRLKLAVEARIKAEKAYKEAFSRFLVRARVAVSDLGSQRLRMAFD